MLCETLCRDTQVLMSQSPYMFDGTTLKPASALAMKSLGAIDGGSKAIVADESMVSRRSLDNVVRYLNGIGIETLELQELEGGE